MQTDKDVAISARGIKKIYGRGDSAFEALSGVDLEIYQGEAVAIVGKSGSGKSTLMHILALLDKPSKGEVYIGETNASRLRGRKLNKLRNRTFGFIFQQFFMNANDSVLNNVVLPLKIGKVSGGKRKKLAMDALEAVDLLDKRRNKAKNLSGGQKQRVCIARAIVNDPDIIFADEPTGNLDSGTSELIEKLLFGLHKKYNTTLIVVTHDEDLAKKCDRRIELRDGAIISDEKVVATAANKLSETGSQPRFAMNQFGQEAGVQTGEVSSKLAQNIARSSQMSDLNAVTQTGEILPTRQSSVLGARQAAMQSVGQLSAQSAGQYDSGYADYLGGYSNGGYGSGDYSNGGYGNDSYGAGGYGIGNEQQYQGQYYAQADQYVDQDGSRYQDRAASQYQTNQPCFAGEQFYDPYANSSSDGRLVDQYAQYGQSQGGGYANY